ncbi:MAG: hypothetical protein DRH17_04340 [Deltaproteobacteria bacterium]|nr:MAG: hypothetical protein DRH17_04340 [Deltaproteobacteria bacterium]
MLSKIGIAGKFILINSLVIIVLLAIITFVTVTTANKYQSKQANVFIKSLKAEQSNEEKLLRQALFQKGESITALLAQTASSLIIGYDFDTLGRLAQSGSRDQDIVFVTFYDKDEKPITEQVSQQSGIETIKQEVLFEEELVGFVEVGLDFASVKNNINEVSARIDKMIQDTSKAKEEALRSIINLIVVYAAVGVVALCLAIYFSLSYIVTKPINGTIDMLKDVAEGEGDLTARLAVKSKDEVGELSNWFNIFVEKLQGMIKDIAENAKTLSTSSSNLSNLSGQMSDGINNVSSKSNIVATAGEEMSSNMHSVATAMEQAATNVNMVATTIEEIAATVNEIAQNSEKARAITGEAVSQSQRASDRVEELGKAAQEIGEVTETITEISEQTNLLALNATIEAARAGEAGKGFAVVANEIKELAMQTAEATQEIKEKIDGIQGSTAGTITEIEQITKIINDVNEIVTTIAAAVEEQSATTKEIASNVTQASQGIQEVNENVAQSSMVSAEIAKDIADVHKEANEMSNSSSQVKLSAEELSKLAEQLKDLVGKFKV